MMMMGLHFMKDEDGNPVEPFHTVYVHALGSRQERQKMSKSKGNVIDPAGADRRIWRRRAALSRWRSWQPRAVT